MVLSIVSCVLPIFFVNHHSSHPCIVHLYTVLAKISFIPISLHKLTHLSRVRARWRALFTSLLIQAPPFSADKSHKKKHDLCKRSTFYFLYKKLMHNCWNTSHKQCVQPQRDHRNFMVIKIKLCEQKSQYDTTQGLQMNTCRHWRPPGTIR